MRISYTTILFFLILTTGIRTVFASTNVSGTIAKDSTWAIAGSPYIVTGAITINTGVTLTIEPGVVIKFDTVVSITVKGTLKAQGTPINRIEFTSNKFIPKSGDWGSIIFNSTSAPYNFNTQAGCVMQYCNLKYGAGDTYGFGTSLIQCINSAPFIDNCILSYGKGAFSINTNLPVTISNNTIINNTMTMGGLGGNAFIYFKSTDSTASFECNLMYNNSGSSTPVIHVLGKGKAKNNIFINNRAISSYVISLDKGTSFIGNTVISNTVQPNGLISNFGNMISNTIQENIFPNYPMVVAMRDSMSTFNRNNISDNYNGSSAPIFPLMDLKSIVVRKSMSSKSLDAKNNWWGSASNEYIISVINDYYDDTTMSKLDYMPYNITPDTTAPVTLVKNVIKTGTVTGDVQLNWDANLETDITGYKIYYGAPTGYSFSHTIDAGNVTSYLLSGVNLFDTIAVTAYDHHAAGSTSQCEGHESWFREALLPVVTNMGSMGNVFELNIFPNPTSDLLNLSITSSTPVDRLQITIDNIIGQQVYFSNNQQPSANNHQIDISSFPNGIYFLQVQAGAEMKKRKFVVQH